MNPTLRSGGRDNEGMDVERLEPLAAVIVTAGLVAGNFLLFTPWRDGQDPREESEISALQNRTARMRDISMNN